MSKNTPKWEPLAPALERMLERLREQNKEHIDEASKPLPKQDEQVN